MIEKQKRSVFGGKTLLRLGLFTLIFVLLSFSFMGVINVEAGQINEKKHPACIGVSIIDAYYGDLDNDGYEDDVLGIIQITKNGINVANMEYVISLILPSGTTYTYLVKVMTNMDIIVLKNFFWDHAYESGDYTLEITLTLINYEKITVSETFTFDPPGSSQGGEPTFDVV